MSLKENDIFFENAREEFGQLVADRDWRGFDRFCLKLSEAGYGELEKKLCETLTLEEVRDYKSWSSNEESEDNYLQDKN